MCRRREIFSLKYHTRDLLKHDEAFGHKKEEDRELCSRVTNILQTKLLQTRDFEI